MSAFGSVFAARGVACGATLLGVMLMSRHVGRAGYGQLVLLLTIMKVAAEFAGPALDTALVRFAAHDEPRALRYAGAILWMKLILCAGVLAAGLVAAKPLQSLLFNGAAPAGAPGVPAWAVTLACVGAGFAMLWAFAQAWFQAHQQFKRYAGFECAGAAIRLVLVAAVVGAAAFLSWHRTTSIVLLLAAYVAAAGALMGATWAHLPRGLFAKPARLQDVGQDLLHFTKWVFAACCFTTLANRADIFLINWLKLPGEAVGDYAGAVHLVLVGDLVILSLFNVLLPKASGLRTADEMARFLKQFRKPAALAGIGVIPLVLGSKVLARIALGPEFIQTGALFSVLVLGALLSLGCAPAGTVLYG
ncbi:MAG: lipopolysaccharide biosynthesis protein, partial [Candidatus Hydrogenedentes bacterium]|nr:lipopolysaccharide biosynthesis protein [Candidatus Hydrogenedentota bacterium]